MNIVVSGASRGIGYEVVKQFAELGHSVLALARNKEALLKLEKEKGDISILAIDINDESLEESFSSFYQEGDRIDVLINNAGQLINKPFLETLSSDFVQQFESNVLSIVNLSKVCIPYMGENSHVVNITSMGGFQGSSKFSGLSAYSSSKGAVSILSECMAEELKEEGIKVNALALGAVQTEMLEAAFPEYKAPLSAQEMAKYLVNFGLEGYQYYNGKVLPVALGNP
ncbi:MAG: SDR family oxidoreductase [Flavobacteriales bacterium]|nr:SDR family oxidoreductase [Flavobacteriales bacterium]